MPPRRKDIMVPLSRNAYETYMLVLIAVSGLMALLGATRNVPVVPAPLALMWAGLIVLGGAVGLLGMLLPDAVTGLLVGRIAMLFLGPAAIAYGAVLIGVDRTLTGAVSGMFVVGFGTASLWRAVQITSHLHTAIRLRMEAEGARANMANLAYGNSRIRYRTRRRRRHMGTADDASHTRED